MRNLRQVIRVGNSLAITLPIDVVRAGRLKAGDCMVIVNENAHKFSVQSWEAYDAERRKAKAARRDRYD